MDALDQPAGQKKAVSGAAVRKGVKIDASHSIVVL
jgi:hypothetical protein